jgi:hypothetical protein
MNMRLVSSGLAAGAIMLCAGGAFSGGVVKNPVQLVNFDPATRELWAVPQGKSLTTYLDQNFTDYIEGNLHSFEPPDPCFPPAEAWNFTVHYDHKHHTRSTFVYQLLLSFMSELGCAANVTSSTNGAPQPLVSIQPTR